MGRALHQGSARRRGHASPMTRGGSASATDALCWVHAERLVYKLHRRQRPAAQRRRSHAADAGGSIVSSRRCEPRPRPGNGSRTESSGSTASSNAEPDTPPSTSSSNASAPTRAKLLRVLERPEIPSTPTPSENDLRAVAHQAQSLRRNGQRQRTHRPRRRARPRPRHAPNSKSHSSTFRRPLKIQTRRIPPLATLVAPNPI